MKTIYEFYGKDDQLPQVSGGGHAYSSSAKEPPRYIGGRIDVLICDGTSPLRPEGDVLHVEGDVVSIRHIAEELLRTCDLMESLWKEGVGEAAKTYVRCKVCGYYSSQGLIPTQATHGDGRGNGCCGDGTVWIARLVLVAGSNEPIDARELYAGQQFTIADPIGEHEQGRVFIALENGTRRGVRVSRDP